LQKNKVSYQNIHFGKIILVLLLVLGQVLTVNPNEVEASEQLYYYDKYWYKDGPYMDYYPYPIYDDNYKGIYTNIDYEGATSTLSADASVVLLESGLVDGKTVYVYEVYTWIDYFTIGTNYKYIYTEKPYREVANSHTRYIGTFEHRFSGTAFEFRDCKVAHIQSGQRGVVTFLINQNLILSGTYPENGLHSDGYWYVRKGLANNDPTITTTSPVQNSYFSKVNQA